MPDTFNRTKLELKQGTEDATYEIPGPFNRTKLELKRTFPSGVTTVISTFNRTKLELKHEDNYFYPKVPKIL